jgi:hypothetical protein
MSKHLFKIKMSWREYKWGNKKNWIWCLNRRGNKKKLEKKMKGNNNKCKKDWFKENKIWDKVNWSKNMKEFKEKEIENLNNKEKNRNKKN